MSSRIPGSLMAIIIAAVVAVILALVLLVVLLWQDRDQVRAQSAQLQQQLAEIVMQNRGPRGDDGASAYDIAVRNGFTGTEQAWLESLRGTPGANGINGTDGAVGPAGRAGVDGSGITRVSCSGTALNFYAGARLVNSVAMVCIP